MSEYNDISQLDQLDPTTPEMGAAVVSELDDAIRQIKQFLTTYLAIALNNDGTIKAGAVSGTAIPDLSIVEAKLADGAVTEPKLAALAVTLSKIANGAVDSTKIAAGAVTTTLLADGSVSTPKIVDLAVTAAKIADDTITGSKIKSSASVDGDRPIGTNHLKDGSVSTAKLAAGAIAVEKMGLAGTNVMLFKAATLQEVQIGGILAFESVDQTTTPPTLKFRLNVSSDVSEEGYFRVEERAANGVPAGGTTGGSYVVRDGLWLEAADSDSLVSASGPDIIFQEAGSYEVQVIVPAYSCGRHRARLWNQTTMAPMLVGGNAAAAPGCTTLSIIRGIVFLDVGTTLRVQHWAEFTQADNGLGAPLSNGEQERYAILEGRRLT